MSMRAIARAVRPWAWLGLLSVPAGCRDNGPEPVPSVAPEIRVLSGAGQSDTIGARLRDTVVVEVRDSTGRPRRGVDVRFETQPAADGRYGVMLFMAGQYGSALRQVQTDSAGRAAQALFLGTLPGHALLWVKVPELDVFDTVAVEVRPGAPAKVTVVPADTAVYTGASFPLAVTVADRAGNTRSDVPTVTAGGPVQASPTTISANGVGRGSVVLTAGRASATAFVSVVPRGTIAGVYARGSVGDEQGLVVAELDGSGRRALVDAGRQNPLPWGPMWSPDGARIVYTPPYGNDEVRVVDLAGVVTRLVPEYSSGVNGMAWPQYSRDGAWIYFKGDLSPTGYHHLYRVRPDGSGLERLTPDALAAQGILSASPAPDGRTLVVWYTGTRDPMALLDVATGAWTPLAISGRAPRWSPVDDRIAFVAGAASSTAVQVVHADGSGLRTIAGGIFADGLDWSPDGRWLIARGQGSLVLLNVETGEQLPIPQFRDLVAATWRPLP